MFVCVQQGSGVACVGEHCKSTTLLSFSHSICFSRFRSIHEQLDDVENQSQYYLCKYSNQTCNAKQAIKSEMQSNNAQRLHSHQHKRYCRDTNEARHTERLCRGLLDGANLEREGSEREIQRMHQARKHLLTSKTQTCRQTNRETTEIDTGKVSIKGRVHKRRKTLKAQTTRVPRPQALLASSQKRNIYILK